MFDATVLASALSYQWVASSLPGVQTLTLFQRGQVLVELDYDGDVLRGPEQTSRDGVKSFLFSDGTSLNLRDFLSTLRLEPVAPILGIAPSDAAATEDAPFVMVLPESTFSDPQARPLQLAASLQSGGALPAWLRFNPQNGQFAGTPDNAQVGALQIRVTATNDAGLSVSVVFALTVANTNDSPVLALPLIGQQATEAVAFSFGIPSSTFMDIDAGDVLTLSASLSNGAALPFWLTFNPITKTFSGTPPSTAAGMLDIQVKATDSAGAFATASFTLDIAHVVNGTSADNTLTGTAGRDVIYGLAGNDTIDGGAGADTLIGGAGNDTFVVDDAGDVIIEVANEGTDLVKASVSYALPANVENLTLIGPGAINATGNALANKLTGNAADNRLDGGLGADTLAGGAGNDTYVVDDIGDKITEVLNEGEDTVLASVSYTLAANVENLILTGTAAINGTGNSLANTITGNSGDNLLSGGGGTDTLIGGDGNDTYLAGAGDTIVEAANGGIDAVQSNINWVLAANVENLLLTGTGAIKGTGNASDNILTGNSAANTLTGNAGNDTLDGKAGADLLIGGTGNDTYWLGRGWGNDTIQENDATAGNTDIARFDTGIATDQLWFQHVGNNLEVSIIGTADKFTLSNWYTGSANHVEQFKTSNGKTLLDSQVQSLVSAMAAFSPPAAGQTTLPANYATTLAPVIAANWV